MHADRNIEILDSYYQYIDAEQYEELFDLFAEDIVYHRPGADPIHGKEDFERFYHEERPLEDGQHEIDKYLVDGDQVCARGRFEGRLDGEAIAFGFADIHRFTAEGKIDQRWTYVDIGTV